MTTNTELARAHGALVIESGVLFAPAAQLDAYTFNKHTLVDFARAVQADKQDHSAGGECGRVQVPLTEAQIDKLWTKLMCGQGSGDICDFVRDIEAAHNIHPAATPEKEGAL